MSGAANPTQARAFGTSSPLASLRLARARCPSVAAMDGAKPLEQAIHFAHPLAGGRVAPVFPQTSDPKRAPVLHGDGIRLFGLVALDGLPLEEAVNRQDAPPFTISFPQRRDPAQACENLSSTASCMSAWATASSLSKRERPETRNVTYHVQMVRKCDADHTKKHRMCRGSHHIGFCRRYFTVGALGLWQDWQVYT